MIDVPFPFLMLQNSSVKNIIFKNTTQNATSGCWDVNTRGRRLLLSVLQISTFTLNAINK